MLSTSLIVVDGPKGAGKSTVCQLLVDHLNDHHVSAIYHKHVRDPQDEFTNMTTLITATLHQPKVVVIDRLVWSEWVMSVFLNRGDLKAITAQCVHLDDLLEMSGALHVLLLPEVSTLQARLASRPEAERQKVDMPWETIHPLWRAAHGLSHMVRFDNEDELQQMRLLNYLLVMLGLNSRVTNERYNETEVPTT